MDKILSRIFNFSIYALVFLLPLFFLPWSYEAFGFNKLYLLVFLVLIAFFSWLVHSIFFRKEIKLRLTNFSVGVLVFWLMGAISFFFSLNKEFSFWGAYGRFENGFLVLTGFTVFYLLVSNNLGNSEGNWNGLRSEKIIRLAIFSYAFALLSSFLGISQVLAKFSFLPVVMRQPFFNPAGRSLEIFGSWIAVMIVALAAILLNFIAQDKKNGIEKFFISVLLVFSLIMLFLVGYKPFWLILVLSFLFFIGWSVYSGVFRNNANVLLIPIFCVILSIFFSLPLSDNFSRLAQPANIAAIPRERNISQSASWHIAFSSLKENPIQTLVGSGIGNFSYNFSKYKPASLNQDRIYWTVRTDRSGNHFAEILATMGVLGFFSYMAIIIIFFLAFFRAIKGKMYSCGYELALASVFLAISISSFAFYQSFVLAFSFWIVLALGERIFAKDIFSFSVKTDKAPEVALLINTVFVIISIAGLVFAYSLAKNYQADNLFLVAQQEKSFLPISYLEKAVLINPNNGAYLRALSQVYWRDIENDMRSGDAKKTDIIKTKIERLLGVLDSVTQKQPYEVESWETKSLYFKELNPVIGGLQEKTLKVFEEALKLDPVNPVFYLEIGKLYLAQQDFPKAEEYFNKALSLKPDYADSLVQKANLLEKEGNMDEAIALAEEALKMNPYNNIDGVYNLARLYYNAGRISEAITRLNAIAEVMPNHSNALYSLGLAYTKIGERTKALRLFERVLNLNPGNQDVIQKINQLRAQLSK
ncbi:MAG TPA: tetratricopeptide repeat protein [Candidatus Pacearchaeota archaeon]|nr:tetratricopeptide repeat protein [Candidatus Pacearchaeota archaeon]